MTRTLPDGWESMKLKDICKVRQGLQIPIEKRSKIPGKNKLPYLTTSWINSGFSISKAEYINSPKESVILKENEFVVGRTGAVGELFEGMTCVFHNNFFAVSTQPKVLKNYLMFFLKSENTQKSILKIAGTTTIPDLNHGDFYSLDIFLPPLSEQKKIVEILSTIDRSISIRAKYSNSIAQTTRFIADEIFQQATINYKSIKIGDCTKRLWQGINTAADKVNYYEKGVPILQAKHITTGEIQMDGSRNICVQDYARYYERYQPHIGDILFTNIGTIGKSALILEQTKFLVAWNIFLISPIEKIISGEYLHYFLQVLDQRDYFREHAAGNATKFINKTLISELEVPLPPLEEQTRICTQIRAMKKAECSSRQILSKHIELKKALSHDLLSGHKRVKI